MKTVYSTLNMADMAFAQEILDTNGIRNTVTNQFLSAAQGEIPAILCWPQLVVNEEDHAAASQLLSQAFAVKSAPRQEWRCECGETVEGQFSSCWNCGKVREMNT